MISQVLDPDTMPEDARWAEIASLLALGYLRLKFRQKESNCLELDRHSTAQCVSKPYGDGAVAGKETA